MASYDDFGDDFSGDDDMGAVMVRNQRGSVRAPSIINRIAGVTKPSSKDVPLGFGSQTHTDLVQPTGGTLVARPQVPFRGRRLVIQVTRNAAAVAAGLAVNLTALLVGSKNQLAASTAVPADVFGSTATNVELMLDSATPGIDISLIYSFTAALAVGEIIIVQAAIIGDSIS